MTTWLSTRLVARTAATAILAVPLIALGGPATAATTCANPNQQVGSWFDGAYFDPTGWDTHGSTAYFQRTAHPAICSNATYKSDSSAWSMVAGDDAGEGYGQIGFLWRTNDSNNSIFFMEYLVEQYCFPGCWAFQSQGLGNPQQGNTYHFTVSRFPGDGHLHFLRDGVDYGSTGFDPIQEWVHTQGQWFSEVQDPGSDVWGLPSNHMDVTGVKSKIPSGVWEEHAIAMSTDRCYFDYNRLSNSSFKVWTAALNHVC